MSGYTLLDRIHLNGTVPKIFRIGPVLKWANILRKGGERKDILRQRVFLHSVLVSIVFQENSYDLCSKSN